MKQFATGKNVVLQATSLYLVFMGVTGVQQNTRVFRSGNPNPFITKIPTKPPTFLSDGTYSPTGERRCRSS